MILNQKKMGHLSAIIVSGVALVASVVGGAEDAQAGSITVTPKSGLTMGATPLFTNATQQGATVTWDYFDLPNAASPTQVFKGTIESKLYHDLGADNAVGGVGVNQDQTHMVYKISHHADSDPAGPFDQFDIDDLASGLTLSTDVVEGGYITGGPVLDSLTTFTGGTKGIQFNWRGDPIAPGEMTTVYVTYDGLRTALIFNGEVQDFIYDDDDNNVILSVGVPEPTTMALLGIGLLGVARRARKKNRSTTSAS